MGMFFTDDVQADSQRLVDMRGILGNVGHKKGKHTSQTGACFEEI